MIRFATLTLALSLAVWSAAPRRAAADRPDTPGTTELFRYDASDAVETYGSPGGDFLLHFTRDGLNAVPTTDTDDSGVPDYVERLAALYDEVLAFYRDELGFRKPLSDEPIADNGGDGRFDVYLLDFGGGSDGAFRRDGCGIAGARPSQCVGFMVQENDFAGYGYPSLDYASRVLSSHEYFHAVQAAYHSDQGSVFGEGTAVWATDTFDPTLRDLESYSHGLLEHLDRPIDRGFSGPVDPFSYGAGLFFRFLEERFDRSIVRLLWEASETDDWMSALESVLAREFASSFAEAFTEFARWNLYTGTTANPAVAYAEGAMYPPVTMSLVSLPFRSPSPLRVFYASAQYFRADPGTRATTVAALAGDSDGLELVFAVRRGTTVEVADQPSALTAGADEVLVTVVNPARSGESIRPVLCIGSPDEVQSCVEETELPTGDGGAPTGTDAGLGDGGASAEGGSGCAVAAPGHPLSGSRLAKSRPSGALALLGLALLGLLFRLAPCLTRIHRAR